MRFSLEQAGKRREFFRAAARCGALGLLGVASGLMLRARTAASQSCINSGLCRGCSVFSSCGLPQALSAKQAQGGPNQERKL